MAQLLSKIRSIDKILTLNAPGSPYKGLNTHFEDIILLAPLAVTKFSKCTGRNQPIYEYHLTIASRNSVKHLFSTILTFLLLMYKTITGVNLLVIHKFLCAALKIEVFSVLVHKTSHLKLMFFRSPNYNQMLTRTHL